MTMTIAPTIQTMLFMMFPFLGFRGSNRVNKKMHYTRVGIIGVSGRTLGTVARIWSDSFLPRRRLEPRCPNYTPMRREAVFEFFPLMSVCLVSV